jgi:hypothetical protein
MNSPADRAIATAMEGKRASYTWPTKEAARVLNMHVNKVNQWWGANRDKLIELYVAMPGETAAEFLMIIAAGERERARRGAPAASSPLTTPTTRAGGATAASAPFRR